jgi:hypothetical protein
LNPQRPDGIEQNYQPDQRRYSRSVSHGPPSDPGVGATFMPSAGAPACGLGRGSNRREFRLKRRSARRPEIFPAARLLAENVNDPYGRPRLNENR